MELITAAEKRTHAPRAGAAQKARPPGSPRPGTASGRPASPSASDFGTSHFVSASSDFGDTVTGDSQLVSSSFGGEEADAPS